jgi:SMC interacting uncharacterized protein involved in chromosome segregation
MVHLPQSYFFYKEQLHKAQEEKKELKKAYEEKVGGLMKEIDYLKEQIDAQHIMIKNTVEYALKLESEIQKFKGKIKKNQNGHEVEG